jgi:uncharacterized protein (DUF433 family)
MVGKPVVRGTRIPIELLLRLLGGGHSIEDILEDYPHLTREDILAAQAFAADYLNTARFAMADDSDATRTVPLSRDPEGQSVRISKGWELDGREAVIRQLPDGKLVLLPTEEVDSSTNCLRTLLVE